MKGVICKNHRSWLASHVARQSPAAVELESVSHDLLAMCDSAVITHIANEIGTSYEQATRIANSNLFPSFHKDAEFEMPDGSSVGRLDTSFRCLAYSTTVQVGSDVAHDFFDLYSRYDRLGTATRVIETEAHDYFINTCRTYTQLKKLHNSLYTSLLNAYGINEATNNPLALSGTGRIAELINSLAGGNNGA